ncbi:AprI/Inh family metalloprotease inhibitor [Methylobacterium organophilum]|uniref:Alkaline proteinase inhibitor/ Outer membrane lipoprotein Omp19 domain-containing protein n=1 Tax=Methylobacterium organophilum TaxID=410 RepID=A0ABQ4T9S7_METOR|nr:AprI/Inh family metalloprotease inhibitor [Methylobacterium organophilum]GJE27998.1 hypothetical protein LKMONMHP_2861 [Methylobacterium organophilum]
MKIPATACALACAAWLSAAPARGQEPPGTGMALPEGEAPALGRTLPDSLSEAEGTWDLANEGGSRRCMLTLSLESGPNGRAVRFPAGCRRALPLLGKVAGWLIGDGKIRLVDSNVRPLLIFSKSADERSLTASAEDGTRYHFVPLQIALMAPKPAAGEPQAPAEAEAGASRTIPGAAPVLPADALRPAEAAAPPAPAPARAGFTPGIYALDRFAESDTCRLSLEPGADPSPARLMPECRDRGIKTFDPVSWHFADGHLTLKARRGHALALVRTPDGTWRRDPDVGTTFVLRRVGP